MPRPNEQQRRALLAVVLLACLAGCTRTVYVTVPTTEAPTTTSSTSSTSTTTTTAPEPITTAPAPATTLPDAAADVRIARCGPSGDQVIVAQADLTITNHLTVPASYRIVVAFTSPDGSTQYDTRPAGADYVSPGQQAKTYTFSMRIDGRQPFACKVVSVQRT
jgi:hypothetical protein